MRKDIQHLKIDSLIPENCESENSFFLTSEGIKVKKTYTERDILDIEHIGFAASFAPNLRGSYSTMYVCEPWITNQIANLSTLKKSNAPFKKTIKSEPDNFTITFKFTTQQKGDFNHKNESNKTAIVIDSVEDMKILFDRNAFAYNSINLNTNEEVLAIISFYIVAATEQGVDPKSVSISLQNNISKALLQSDTYSSTLWSKISKDIFEYTNKNISTANFITVSGYSLQEVGATADIEIAYTLAYGFEYLQQALTTGTQIDHLAPRLSFLWAIGMDHFMEIAKMRAGRMLWAKLLKEFDPKNEKSLALIAHCQTSGRSLTEEDPFNNIARTCIESAAAVFGGTQSLQTNTLEKVSTLPIDFSNRISNNTQLFLQDETHITQTVDPWAGSFYVESLTSEITQKAWDLICEVKEIGGMTKAIEAGIPKLRIEEAIARKQARFDNGQDIIVGATNYRLDKEASLQNVEKENQTRSHKQQPSQIKTTRNNENVIKALQKITECHKTGEGNLLSLTIEAAKYRATLGEICDALK